VLGGRRVVFASTEGVYGRANAMEVNRRLVETSPYGYNSLYGATKAANELLGHAYVAGWGLDFLVLRLSAVFGPGTFVAGSVAGEFMHALVSAAVERRPLRVRPWSGRREYTYARDIARAVASACSAQGLRHRIFNVGVGRTYTLDDILAALRRAEPEVEVTVVGEVDQGLARAGRDSPFDTKRAREELGWEAEFELEAAFRDYAAALRRSR